MTAVLIGLVWLVLILVILLVAASSRIERLYERIDFIQSAGHDQCTGIIADFVGRDHAAQVLEQAADSFASPKGQHRLTVIGREAYYMLDSEPTPAIWLRQEAERLREGKS